MQKSIPLWKIHLPTPLGEKHSSQVLSQPTAGADAAPAITGGTGRGDTGQCRIAERGKQSECSSLHSPALCHSCIWGQVTHFSSKDLLLSPKTHYVGKKHQQLPQIPAVLRQEQCQRGAAGAEHH